MALSAEQIAARREGIGGSDAAAAVNLSRWKSPLRLWLEKIGEREPEITTSEAAHFGALLENVIAQEFARRRGVRVQRDNRTLKHRDHNFMLAHIDRRLIGVREGLEVKCASLRMARDWGDEDTDQVPAEYLAQATHYLAVTGFSAWHMAVLLGGNELRTYRIPRDEELIAMLTERELQFWECVKTRVPPEPTTLQDAYIRWPNDTGRHVPATFDVAEAVRELRQLKDDGSKLRARMDQVQLKIERHMQDASALTDEAGNIMATWKQQGVRRVDVALLRETYPHIAQQCERADSLRVFRLK